LIVHDPAPSALNTLMNQSAHDDINASNPPLQQSHCHISENNHSDIVHKEETLADISSKKSYELKWKEIYFLQFSLLSLKCMHRKNRAPSIAGEQISKESLEYQQR
jgi:hypothetical protein